MSLPVRKKYRITRWAPPDELIQTRLCRMCYRRWLTDESIRRMDKSLQDSWVEVGEGGDVALFVWEDTIIKITPEEEEV
jgi:hypothetical protein